MTIFIGVATSLAGVLTSSIAAHSVSRERTLAEQIAADQVESIRRLPYDDVGTVSGNPPGTVAASRTVTQNGLTATVSTQISYVNDPTPTSYATGANYKRVTVTVTRVRDGKQLTRVVTNIAPPARAPYGGINNAIVNVQVLDYALLTAVPGASVTIANGPSPSRTDVTDSTGTVSFAALTPNPLTGPTAYYDLTVSDTGYVTFAGDVPPEAAAHVQLAPSQTLSTAIRIFKPATIILQMVNADGSPYTGTATVKVTSGLTGVTKTIVVTGGSATLTDLKGDPIVPGVTYTVKGLKANGQCADPAPRYVPDDYPTDLTTTFVLTWGACPSGTLAVNVQQLGLNVPGATVDVTGGPNGVSLSGTTDANGDVSFAAPEGAGYTVTATKGSETGSATASVTASTTTNVAVTLGPPPTGSILATAMWAGSPVASCTNCVTLSGGPNAISVAGSTDASGQVTFTNVPVGSGYTVTATKNTFSGTATATVTDSTTTPVTVDLPTGTITVTATWAALYAGNATVSITGGPNGGTYTGTTNATTGITPAITVPATTASYPYTVTVTKNTGSSGAISVTSVTTGMDTPVAAAILPTKNLVLTLRRGSSTSFTTIPTTAVTVSLTAGPNGTANAQPAYQYIGNTSATSTVTLTVPSVAGTAYTYRVKVYITACPTSPSTANRSRTTTVNARTTTTAATIYLNNSTCPVAIP